MSGEHEYELLERIGIGGMAEVYRANALGAEGFERPIAIKRILPNLAEDEDFVKMFIDEAKIAVQLSHPNIVGIFDLGRFGDDYFIAMELVHGRDLRQIQDREAQLGRRMPLEIALHAGMKVCEALHHAHYKGGGGHDGEAVYIIHRDVSPQNVLVSYDGQVKVTDFGLAKAAGRAVQTQAGIIKGKLAYMSPEQLTTVPIDQRSDVFAAGTLLWEMLTGERLFLGSNDRETIQKVFQAKVASPRSLDPAIPIELDRVVMKALAKDRDQRYRTAQEFHDDLEETGYLVNAMVGAPSVSAYMRALFPEVEVSGSARRRDPRAATAEIRLSEMANPPPPSSFSLADAEELDPGELDDDDDEDVLDDDELQPEPESISPPPIEEDDEPDPEESRKTIPPIGLLELPAPGPDTTLLTPPSRHVSHAEPREPSSTRATNKPPGSQGSGPRVVMPKMQAPSPIIGATGARQMPPTTSAAPMSSGPPVRPSEHPAYGDDDDFADRTMFGGPRFDLHADTSSPTLDFNGEQLAAQLDKLEALADTTGSNRLPPEELMTTKHAEPSGELLARARERDAATAPRPREAVRPPVARDTIPPSDDYDDRTMIGGHTEDGPTPPVVGPQEWEDETTPIGDDRRKQGRR